MKPQEHKESFKKLCDAKPEEIMELKSMGGFDEEFHKKVKLEAAKRKTFMNVLITEAVREYLDNHPIK